jgi:hypothetical protein
MSMLQLSVSESLCPAGMSGADHAILDLGEDELQFTTTDYKAQVGGLREQARNTCTTMT